MNRNKWRPLFILMALIILIMIFFKCCIGNNKNDKKSPKDKNNNVSETGVSSFGPDVSDIRSSETVTAKATPEYSDLSELDLLDVEFQPDDISLVNTEYLDDIVIIGDSITKGYSVYGRMNVNNVLAVGSVGARNLFTYKYEYQGYSLDLLDILSRKLPKYIFISLGMNDVNLLSEEEFTDVYKENINEILKVTPDSTIVVTAITPVTSDTDFTQNEKIDTYNEALRKMVVEMNNDCTYYINAAQYLKNEYGSLLSEFSSGDGIHLSSSAYDYLLSYMLMLLDWI